MTDVAFLLVLLFSMKIEAPKVPDRIPHPEYDIEEVQEELKTIYTMTDAELSALSVKQKAKLVGISAKSFKEFTKVVNHEAGPKMQDKVIVAAVIWNRVKCSQFKNSVVKALNEPGQFYDVKHTREGSSKDKKAQLAILLAYRDIKLGKIPHNVLYFNAISYKTKNTKRFKKYKHYNNYFIIDSKCKCRWCSV
jgi:hypothetical protein